MEAGTGWPDFYWEVLAAGIAKMDLFSALGTFLSGVYSFAEESATPGFVLIGPSMLVAARIIPTPC